MPGKRLMVLNPLKASCFFLVVSRWCSKSCRDPHPLRWRYLSSKVRDLQRMACSTVWENFPNSLCCLSCNRYVCKKNFKLKLLYHFNTFKKPWLHSVNPGLVSTNILLLFLDLASILFWIAYSCYSCSIYLWYIQRLPFTISWRWQLVGTWPMACSFYMVRFNNNLKAVPFGVTVFSKSEVPCNCSSEDWINVLVKAEW